MKRTLLVPACFALTLASFGQARLVLNNNVWMVIDNQAWVVVENPGANAITELPTSATGGNILSENEFDRLRWQISNTTGTYVVPFTTPPPTATKMPLTYQVTVAGTAGGSAVFSTYNYFGSAPSWDNTVYMPSDVTHMNYYSSGLPNNSGNVVDRFWEVDTKAAGYSYATSPTAILTFVYDVADITAGNTINGTSNLDAQRFNNTSNMWGDVLFPASAWSNIGGVRRQVVTPVITPAQFFRSWTLSDENNPLPIELIDFRGNCEGNRVVISWTTASEQNNDYFTVEKSHNGVDWQAIGTIEGAGSSSEMLNYSFVDETPTGLAYYRLAQTDFDGSMEYSNMVAAGCDGNGGLDIVSVFDDGNDVNIIVSSSFDVIHDVTLMDVHGMVLGVMERQAVETGIAHLRLSKGTIATGIYVVRLSNNDQVLSRKVVLN